MTPEAIAARKQLFYERSGGFVKNDKSGSGKFVFVNAQKRFPASALEGLAGRLERRWRIRFEVIPSEPVVLKDALKTRERVGAGSAVIVTELEAEQPALLVLPDERCAFVNVAALPAEASEELLRKEVARGFAACSGAMTSQREPTLMGSFDNLKQLNAYRNDEIPADVSLKVIGNMRQYGVTPYKLETYRTACEQGWAPSPTNDVQKKIWNAVHELPSKPLKIEK